MPLIQPTYTIEELIKIYIDYKLRGIEEHHLQNNSHETRLEVFNKMVEINNSKDFDPETRQYIYSKLKLIYESMCAATLNKN